MTVNFMTCFIQASNVSVALCVDVMLEHSLIPPFSFLPNMSTPFDQVARSDAKGTGLLLEGKGILLVANIATLSQKVARRNDTVLCK